MRSDYRLFLIRVSLSRSGLPLMPDTRAEDSGESPGRSGMAPCSCRNPPGRIDRVFVVPSS